MATYVGCHKAARDLSCVWPTWIRDTFAPAHTQLFGGEISESLQSQNYAKTILQPQQQHQQQQQQTANKLQLHVATTTPASATTTATTAKPRQELRAQIQIQSRRQRRGKCAFCGSGAAFRVFGILRKSFRNICAPNNYGKHFRIRNYLAVSIYLPLRQKEKPFSSYS